MEQKKIRVIQRIPTATYAYLELEMEYETPEEAFIDHDRLTAFSEAGTGLGTREWAQVRNNMLVTGECDVNLLESMNKAQRWFINELKLAFRSHKVEDDVSNIID